MKELCSNLVSEGDHQLDLVQCFKSAKSDWCPPHATTDMCDLL